MRLIDADKLKEAFYNRKRTPDDMKYLRVPAEVVYQFIDTAPTVDITEEQAIDKLHETGWLPMHDKEMTERPQGEWIPVSERLPEKNGYYLVTRKGFSIKNHVKRVGYDANTKRWSEGSIIAWQPLPEPYKEGGAE